MGTANNIASTLGMAGRTVEELIAGWKVARCIHFDAGLAKGPWGSKHFIEGFGLGLFAETMFRIDSSDKKNLAHAPDPQDELNSVLKMLKGRLRHLKNKELTIRLDGKDLSGKYALVEALNGRFIGPNLNLAPKADIKDGFLDIVAVPYRDRAKLGQYLSKCINGDAGSHGFPILRGRHLQIELENSPVHIDDIRWPEEGVALKSHAITIQVEPGALVFLTQPVKKLRGKRRS